MTVLEEPYKAMLFFYLQSLEFEQMTVAENQAYSLNCSQLKLVVANTLDYASDGSQHVIWY